MTIVHSLDDIFTTRCPLEGTFPFVGQINPQSGGGGAGFFYGCPSGIPTGSPCLGAFDGINWSNTMTIERVPPP
jgi:hypothetical protein